MQDKPVVVSTYTIFVTNKYALFNTKADLNTQTKFLIINYKLLNHHEKKFIINHFNCIIHFSFCTKKDNRLAGMDTMINRILKEWNVPGVSISVVEKNKVILSKGYGYKDYENKKLVTENTLFGIGSCTKAFTSSLLSLPMKEGKLELDKSITNYLPELRFYNNELTANVTVRDMLCHRTGLARHDFAMYSGVTSSRDSLIYKVRFMEPSTPLRQRFQYNNYMYLALGKLSETLSGKTWKQLMHERFFTPLAMNSSNTSITESEKASDFSYAYTEKEGKVIKLPFLDVECIAPAGAVNSTAKDMANWMLMWTNGGKFNGKEIVSHDFYTQAISSQMVARANLPTKEQPDFYFFNYGLGWYNANYGGQYGVGHGGNIDGFTSYLIFFPADSLGIFVVANQNNSAVPRIVTNLLSDRMMGIPFRDWHRITKDAADKTTAATKAANMENSKVNAKLPVDLMVYTGTYKDEAYGMITINQENDRLTGTYNLWKLKIEYLHHNYFKFSVANNDVFDGSEAIKGQFMINADGAVESLKMPFETDVKEIEFKKQLNFTVKIKDLQKYIGDYDFTGVTAKIYLTESNILKAVVPGQPEYELIPVRLDVFYLKGAKGVSIKFERDEQGNVPGCSFIQPNGTFKVKKIIKAAIKSEVKKAVTPAVNSEGDFQKYVGDYYLGGQVVKIYINENLLMALIPGQPEYTLMPVKGNEFEVKGANGYSVNFEKDDKENIIGFTLVQPSGKMKATKKI